MEKALTLIRKNWYYLTGALIGGGGAFLYWYKIGCSTGACPITSSPVLSTLWGMIMGGLLFSLFFANKKSGSAGEK